MKKKRSVLIAEDEKAIALYMEKALTRIDISVFVAYDGKMALDKILKEKPNAILLDILMPKMSGIDVIRAIKKSGPPYSDIPIIVLSALDKTYEIREAMEAGANSYLSKPLFTDEIIEELQKWLT